MATFFALGLLATAALVLLTLGLRRPVLLLLGVVFTMSLDYIGRLGLGELTANNLLKAVAMGVVAIRMLQTGEGFRVPGHLVHFLPFLLVAGVGVFHSPLFFGGAIAWSRLVFIWAFAILLANLLTRERDLRWLLHVFALVLILNTLLAAIQASQVFSQGMLAIHGSGQSFRVGSRVSGAFFNPNKLAAQLVGMVVLLFASLPSMPRLRTRVIYIAAIFMAFVIVLLSQSRSGYLALALAAILFLFSPRHRRLTAALAGIAILGVAFVLVMTPYGPDLADRLRSFTQLEADRSGQVRMSLVTSGLRIFADGFNVIWGAGYEAFQRSMVSHIDPLFNHDGYYHAGIRVSHNLWITIIAELGILGAVAVLLFLRGIYRELAAQLRSANGLRHDLLVGLLVYVTVKLVDFNFNPEFEENLFWYALGLLGALAVMGEAPSPIDPPAPEC